MQTASPDATDAPESARSTTDPRTSISPALPDPTITFETYAEIREALHDPLLTRGFDKRTYEAGNSGEGTVSTAEGSLHRARRRIENTQFRLDRLREYEHVVLPEALRRLTDRLIDGERVDLCDIAPLISATVAARRAGLDHDEDSVDQLRALVRCSDVFSAGLGPGILEAKDPEAIHDLLMATLDEFERDFVRPSWDRRADLIARYRAGELDESSLPQDVLTVLLLHRDDAAVELADDGRIVREVATYLQGGTHSSAQTLMHTLDLLFPYAEHHPGVWSEIVADPMLALRCVHEALRLRPSTPLVKRIAEGDTSVGGRPVPAGSIVVLDVGAANREAGVFGADPDAFDPYRAIEHPNPRWGLSFGLGPHQCPGRLSAGGLPVPAEGVAGPDHLYGSVALLLVEMVRRGVRRDPERPPVEDPDTVRPGSIISFPVILPSA